MLLARLVSTSASVSATRSRLEKVALLAECIRQLSPEEKVLGIAYLCGELPQGKLGVGFASLP
ncbi:MAG TPA: ATP-dependent DNA ligase, partial [Polyangiaceae bacterium]|nr:ATP-dependent DNA ligase [Polyangiaceae bacterium]